MSTTASAKDRRRILLERAQQEGYVGVYGLARQHGVNESTIYRDLMYLERAGLIRKERGGFLPAEPEAAVDVPYSVRQAENAAAKKSLARAAADMVLDRQSVIVDSGSTMYHLAFELRARDGLSVVTNDLKVGVQSAGHPTNRLHVTGGSLVDTVYTLVGQETVAALENLHVDWAFIAAEAVHPEAGVSNINFIEPPVKQAMIAAADRAVLVVDSSKFGRRSLAPVCPLAAFDTILTDDALSEEQRSSYGTRLRIVRS